MSKIISFVLLLLFSKISGIAQNSNLKAGLANAAINNYEFSLVNFEDYKTYVELNYGKQSIQYLEALYYISASHFNLNKSDKGLTHMKMAIAFSEEALVLVKKLVNKNHPGLMLHYSYLEECYYAMADLVADSEESEDKDEIYWRDKSRTVGQLFEGEFKVLPIERNREYVQMLNRLTTYFGAVNAIVLAEQFHYGALYINELTSGSQSNGYAETLTIMADVYVSYGSRENMEPENNEDAKSLLLEAIDIYLKNPLKKDDSLFFNCLDKLQYFTLLAKNNKSANTSFTQWTIEDAKIYNLFLKRHSLILTSIKSVLGEDNDQYRKYLEYFAKFVYWEDMQKSIPLWEEAFYLQEKRLEKDKIFDYDYTSALDYLIDVYEGTFQRKKAENLYLRLLKVVEQNVGKEDFFDKDNTYSNCILRLTNFYAAEHKYAEMIPWLEQYLKLNQKSTSTVYDKTLAQLVYAYYKINNSLKAEALRQTIYKTVIKQASDADRYSYLPDVFIANGDSRGAIKEYQFIIQKQERELGKDNLGLIGWLEKILDQNERLNQLNQMESAYKRILQIREANGQKVSYSYLYNLVNLAYVQYQLKNSDYETSLKKAQLLAIKVDELHDWNGEEEYYRQTMIAFNQEKYVKAEWLMQAYMTQPSKKEDLQCVTQMGNIYYYSNQNTKAEILYNTALGAMRKTNFDHNIYDVVHFYTGTFQYDKALSIYQEYLSKIDESEKQKPWFASCLNEYGNICFRQSKWKEADSLYKQALVLLEPLKEINRYDGNHDIRASVLNNLGILNEEVGRYDIAEMYYNKSLTIYNQYLSPSSDFVVTTNRQLAWIYELLGQHEASEKMFLRTLNELDKQNKDQKLSYALALHNLALIKFRSGDYSNAKRMEEEVLQIYSDIYPDEHPEVATIQNTLAHDYLFTGEFDKAERLYEKSYAIQSAVHSDSLSLGYVMNGMGNLYTLTDRNEKAEEMYKRTLRLREKLLGQEHAVYLQSLFNLARYYHFTGRCIEAEQLFVQCNQINLHQLESNTNYLSEHEKALYKEQNQKYVDGFVNYVIDRSGSSPYMQISSLNQSRKVIGDLFDFQLVSKGWVLSNSTKIKKRIIGSGNKDLINKYNKWEGYKNRIAKATRLNEEERGNAGINLDTWNKELTQLEKELSASAEQYNVVFNPSVAKWQDIQKALKPGEAAVEIIRTLYTKNNAITIKPDTFYVALIVTSATLESPEIVVLRDGQKMESKWLKLYRNSAIYKIEDNDSYNSFWLPISKKLNGISKVYYSPDGVYHQINLNTLKNPSTGKFVIDELEIHQMTNLNELLSTDLGGKINKSPNATVVGDPTFNLNDKETFHDSKKEGNNSTRGAEDFRGVAIEPLPGTLQEVTGIKNVLAKKKWNISLYTGKQALEENVKGVHSPTILHIATHGFFINNERSNSNPMLLSGLILTGAVSNLNNPSNSNEDGILTAYEATSLDLEGTNLVILSACETGLGEVAVGEGVYGLQRGFKVAGAKSIVISLWKVNDSVTQELMFLFYKNWLKSGNSRTAFINAQRAIKEKYKDAYYWGAFVMVGE